MVMGAGYQLGEIGQVNAMGRWKKKKVREKRDSEIRKMKALGYSNDQIAKSFGISQGHVGEILKKGEP